VEVLGEAEELALAALVYRGIDDEQVVVGRGNRLPKQGVCVDTRQRNKQRAGQVLGRADTEPRRNSLQGRKKGQD
jgi:hypothetical protein